ncbi:type IV toxin-antitoxin system AbiEi family antitoxin [Paraflavisolibacter sp. H34]|uniref:type IV toxin-antitoxin system AbiEi family antitoxin n=1 Tax=Huijunlia imazamoxiresistens TaxID=3127457 RepID=UPI00301718EC
MEQEIVHTAIENLYSQTRIKATWNKRAKDKPGGDLLLDLGAQTVRFQTEVKKEVRGQHLHGILETAAGNETFLLLAGHILPSVKGTLREAGIAYLEANGNLFIRRQGIFLWIETQKPLKLAPERGNRAFTKTGVKALFLFLQDETWLNKPYRQIAALTGTGIGNITNIIKGLKAEGFLLQVAKNEYKLHNRKDLESRWISAYETRLKPDLKIGTFRFLSEAEQAKWKALPLKPGKTFWGGEPAGDLYTDYLQPAEFTLYTTETRSELIKDYRLAPDKSGNIKVYEKFWNQDGSNNLVVPPLLAYADLLNTNDRRCLETAQKLYEQYLQD